MADNAAVTTVVAESVAEIKPTEIKRLWGDEAEEEQEVDDKSPTATDINIDSLVIDETKKVHKFLDDPEDSNIKALREEFSLCRVCIKSKCLRAFDRRPSASATIGTDDEMVHCHVQYHDHDEETPSHQPTTTSLNQSSTRDHANPNSQNHRRDTISSANRHLAGSELQERPCKP